MAQPAVNNAPAVRVRPAQAVAPRNNPAPRRPARNLAWCRTSEYTPPGSTKRGLDKDNQPAQLVYEIHYGLSKEARDALRLRFPGVAVVSVGAQSHDHPVANVSRKIVWEKSVLSTLTRGGRYVDLYGDPSANNRHNDRSGPNGTKINTLARIVTPKDAIRQARWGARVVDGNERWENLSHYDVYRNENNRARFGEYDGFIGNHTLYYFTMEEVNRLVNIRAPADDRAPVTATFTIHRHGIFDGEGVFKATTSGTLNNGEQSWVRDPITGRVTQVNVATGESYEHPDSEVWFRKFCYADEHGGMAWTVALGCEDHYVVTFTACPVAIVPHDCWRDGRMVRIIDGDRVVVDATPESAASAAPPTYQCAVRKVDFGVFLGQHGISLSSVPGVPVKSSIVSVPVTHPDLFDQLDTWMVNKPRTAATFKDLTAKCKRECGASKLVGGNGVKIKITADEMRDVIALAFVSGVSKDTERIQLSGLGTHRAHDQLLAGNGGIIGGPHSLVARALTLYSDYLSISKGASPSALASINDHWFT